MTDDVDIASVVCNCGACTGMMGICTALSLAMERMQIALIREYPKSVNLHTLHRLHTRWCATRSRVTVCKDTTGSELLWSLHS
jgi:hypothetical protein